MTDALESITGVGPETAKALRAAGYETPEDVHDATVTQLQNVDHIGQSTAESLASGEDPEGRKGKDAKVEEVLDDVREHLEKPISDKAAIAQSPIGRKTHQRWLNEKDGYPYEQYKDMYHEARAVAEEKLVEDGLYGGADSSLVKFLLKATYKYEDKQTKEVKGGLDLGDIID